jgi:hypothetical protein
VRPRKDGSRWDFIVEPWDLESVECDARGGYVALTRDGPVPIVHGDGKWTILRQTHTHTHENGAIVPLAINVASRGHSIVDRSAGAQAVGHPKIHAALPEKVAVDSPVGRSLEVAVQELWQGLRHIVTDNSTKLTKLEFSGQGWQIFPEGLKLDKSDIFLALTGQDGSAANEGGSYAKAYILQGILFAWVVADTMAGSGGYTTGVLRPWAAVNRGDPDEAPVLAWPLPDPEENERLAALAKRHKEYAEAIEAHRKNGFDITPEFATKLAAQMRIDVPPLATKPLPELFAYNQRARLFTRDEHRIARGREPVGGEFGAEYIDDAAQLDKNDSGSVGGQS